MDEDSTSLSILAVEKIQATGASAAVPGARLELPLSSMQRPVHSGCQCQSASASGQPATAEVSLQLELEFPLKLVS